MMEAVRTYETSVYSQETTQRYIPESRHLHTFRRENLKFHKRKSIVPYIFTSRLKNEYK
jgi:hypothetical protein